jgi:hypothetical protein
MPLDQNPSSEGIHLDLDSPRFLSESKLDGCGEARAGFKRWDSPPLTSRDIRQKSDFGNASNGLLH